MAAGSHCRLQPVYRPTGQGAGTPRRPLTIPHTGELRQQHAAKGYDLDPAKYYTNIEVYANSLVQHIMTSGNDGATTAALEYYPAYKREDGTVVPAINTLGLDLSGGTNAVTDVRQTASGTPQKFNINGQRVATGYRGLMIENGRKRMSR